MAFGSMNFGSNVVFPCKNCQKRTNYQNGSTDQRNCHTYCEEYLAALNKHRNITGDIFEQKCMKKKQRSTATIKNRFRSIDLHAMGKV